jgi:hypothetical protein
MPAGLRDDLPVERSAAELEAPPTVPVGEHAEEFDPRRTHDRSRMDGRREVEREQRTRHDLEVGGEFDVLYRCRSAAHREGESRDQREG